MRCTVASVILFATGCATSGGAGGGAENLPNRGIAPYEPIAFLRDTVLSDWLFPPPQTADVPAVREPCLLVHDGQVHLFAHVTFEDRTFIGLARSETGLAFAAPEPVLSDLPEGARAPSVARDPASGRWHMALTIGDTLHHASATTPESFTLDDSPWLEPEGDEEAGGLGAASLVIDGDTLHVFYEARAGEDTPEVIRHTSALLGRGSFGPRKTVLTPLSECTDTQGNPFPCWNKDGVGDPDVRLARTATGRPIWRMFFAGARGDSGSIGFAASFAPDEPFAPYAYNPILEGETKARTAPSQLLWQDRYLLYFAQPGQRPAVGVAENVAGVPSERF